MKKVLLFLSLMVASISLYSKPATPKSDLGSVVKVVTTGTGHTKENAVSNALRSALEQTYGAFVSSTTSIVNDNIVNDAITTVSSGNILKYTILSETCKGGIFYVGLESHVSLTKLANFAESHGAQCNFNGELLANEIKLMKFYEDSEKKAFKNLLSQLKMMSKDMFEFKLEQVGTPKVVDGGYELVFNIIARSNEASNYAANLVWNTLHSLELYDDEVEKYASYGKSVWNVQYAKTVDSESYHFASSWVPDLSMNFHHMKELKSQGKYDEAFRYTKKIRFCVAPPERSRREMLFRADHSAELNEINKLLFNILMTSKIVLKTSSRDDSYFYFKSFDTWYSSGDDYFVFNSKENVEIPIRSRYGGYSRWWCSYSEKFSGQGLDAYGMSREWTSRDSARAVLEDMFPGLVKKAQEAKEGKPQKHNKAQKLLPAETVVLKLTLVVPEEVMPNLTGFELKL